MKSTGLAFAILALTVITVQAGSLHDLTSLSENLSQLFGIDTQGIVDCFDENEASDLVAALNQLSQSLTHLQGSHSDLSNLHYFEAVSLAAGIQGSFECAIDTPAFKELVTSGQTVSLNVISNAWNVWRGSGSESFSSLISDLVNNIDSGDFFTGASNIYILSAIFGRELHNKNAIWDAVYGFVNGLLSARGLYISGDYKGCGYKSNNYDAVKFTYFFAGLSNLYNSDDFTNTVNTYVSQVGPIQFDSLSPEFVSCFFNSTDIKSLEESLHLKLNFNHAAFQNRILSAVQNSPIGLQALNALFNNGDYLLAGQLVSNLLG